MSDKLTPEEIAAFCDAVEWYAINHRDRALSANKFAAQCDLETRWDVVLRILPKIRALAAPAAVPVSELRTLADRFLELAGHDSGTSPAIRQTWYCAAKSVEALIEKHSKEGA